MNTNHISLIDKGNFFHGWKEQQDSYLEQSHWNSKLAQTKAQMRFIWTSWNQEEKMYISLKGDTITI
jgi:hypothetical protein